MRTVCPSCKANRKPADYLCRRCWFRLPQPSRNALNMRDSMASDRLRTLYGLIQDGVPLPEIVIT